MFGAKVIEDFAVAWGMLLAAKKPEKVDESLDSDGAS